MYHEKTVGFSFKPTFSEDKLRKIHMVKWTKSSAIIIFTYYTLPVSQLLQMVIKSIIGLHVSFEVLVYKHRHFQPFL